MIMNATLTIAIIGCITGVSSLLIQLFQYFLTVAKLKIELDQSKYSYLFKATDFGLSGYGCKYAAVVSLKISNCSSFPITINAIVVKNKNFKTRHINNMTFQAMQIRINKNEEPPIYSQYDPSKCIIIPTRLESYDTIFVSARFAFPDRLIDEKHLDEPIDLNLAIATPRKTFRYKVQLYEYARLHDRLREHRKR
jgi:hypothetical protein